MTAPRRWRRATIALGLAGTAMLLAGGGANDKATADATSPPVVAQPVIGLPVSKPTLIGASPSERAGETWGYSDHGDLFQIVRYTPTGGWQIQPGPFDMEGQPLEGFKPAPGPLAGRTTPAGNVAIVGEDAAKVGQVLVRNPEGNFEETPTLTTEPAEEAVKAGGAVEQDDATRGSSETGGQPRTEAGTSGQNGETEEVNDLLKPGETLFASSGEGVLMAPVDQSDSRTAVFLVPFEQGANVQSSVLFYDGSARRWTREPICAGLPTEPEPGVTCTKPTSGFKVLAIDASSTENAWLLAQTGISGEAFALFSRTIVEGQARWVQRPLEAPGQLGALGAFFAQTKHSVSDQTTHESIGVTVSPSSNGQPLTVTGEGIWIDGRLTLSGQAEPSDFTLYYSLAQHGLAASWCSLPAALEFESGSPCKFPLESSLPEGAYRSFAWSGDGPYGQRVITGLANGVTLELSGQSFESVLGLGGEAGTNSGAAFSSPQEGWLADSTQVPLTHITTELGPDRLQPWPVPFRRPLTAIATQPGATPGELGAQAIAVGDYGEVARYMPGQGWVDEAMLNSSGIAQTPDLRGVAWPEPNRAYAVGTDGAMWIWRSETGLWEPDPARPPNLFLANFTGIAFNPSNPAQGYAIGQQGLLLGYGKTWEQEKLPPELEGPNGANFTSIAFAGQEALATYRVPVKFDPVEYAGGVLCNDGSGWQIDEQIDKALGGAIPIRVAGLPDGGAAVAAGGNNGSEVIERQGPGAPCGSEEAGSPWQPAPAGPLDGGPVALSVFREGTALRAVVSVNTTNVGESTSGDEALSETPSEDQAPVATSAYPLPASGYLLRETQSGWEDEEHEDYPTPNGDNRLTSSQSQFDWPYQPDAVLALALAPNGGQGWAVGGQTGEVNTVLGGSHQEDAEEIQTAGVMRYPASGTAPTGFSASPEQTSQSNATFAIGGDAQCATACADLAEDKIGPDMWLSNAIEQAAQTKQTTHTPGVRAFIYSGDHVASGLGNIPAGQGFGTTAFQREEDSYAELLSNAAGALPVYAAPSESDLDQSDTLTSFSAAFQTLAAPQGSATATGVTPVSPTSPNAAYFSFESSGTGGTVRVIVLDYSHPSLGSAQQCWLAMQLAQAKVNREAAIVIGNRGMTEGDNTAADAAQVIPILVNGTPPATEECEKLFVDNKLTQDGGASAYFFDSPEQNRIYTISAGAASIHAYGSGTLGYIARQAQTNTEFLGASGFLLAEVEVAKREEPTYRGVHVKLIPDISELAIDATNGVLLRRSQAALFDALARRPHAGMLCGFDSGYCSFDPDPYVPIPTTCQGSNCSTGIFPEYTFTSSNPDIGDFVEPDPASPEGTTVLQGKNGKPIPDEHSGLFCAYNAGTTTVTVHTGGLSASVPVTILSGSVEQPCGTTPLLNPPAATQQAGLPAPLPAPAPTPAVTPNGVVPPPPAPPAPVPAPVVHHAHPRPPVLPPVPLAPAQLYPLLPILPPPAPSPARPTPPSGTAQVSQTVGVAEQEREEERATEMAHHMAAYEQNPEEGPLPTWPLGLILIAVAAGVGMRRRSKAPELAYTREPRRQRGPRA